MVGESVRRSDECRLLYLTQEERHTRWPICLWMSFGATPLEDTEIDVHLHAKCPDTAFDTQVGTGHVEMVRWRIRYATQP